VRDGRVLVDPPVPPRPWYEFPSCPAAFAENWRWQEIATVCMSDRWERFYLAPDVILPAGETLAWLPLSALAVAPLRPKRLAWRITQWWLDGWPSEPVRLHDSITDPDQYCRW
jgi:hypothetical protein